LNVNPEWSADQKQRVLAIEVEQTAEPGNDRLLPRRQANFDMSNGGMQADAEATHIMPRLMAIMKATTIAITGASANETPSEPPPFLTRAH
jgi:hypothetical protein